MTDQTSAKKTANRKTYVRGIVLILLIGSALIWPEHAKDTTLFVFWSLIEISPIVIPGILLSAWIIASGADSRISGAFEGRTLQSVLTAALIGSITPVCGVTVLPLMAGLLTAGVPLAPIMAFWLSSPVTDPAMLATTIATLGLPFALGKTLAAFGLGVFGGAGTVLFSQKSWALKALRNNAPSQKPNCSACSKPQSFEFRVWRDPARRVSFLKQFRSTTQLILLCLTPAFAAEYLLNASLDPEALASFAGEDKWWAIPAAVLVGAPAYIDGYAALPLTKALIDKGMSHGAAMAFLVSGGVVSIWGAMAIAPVLKLKPFLLYLVLALLGSLAAGYIFQWAQ
ncbi:permease [Kiloniella sp. b19]|uniref:permease n=1 Tax=Kiloniella sp. GXU_MW_B19 TaxID=3141326 RepID=UPI0031DC97A4